MKYSACYEGFVTPMMFEGFPRTWSHDLLKGKQNNQLSIEDVNKKLYGNNWSSEESSRINLLKQKSVISISTVIVQFTEDQ